MPLLFNVSRAPDARVIWVPMSVSLLLTCVTVNVSPSGSLSAPFSLSLSTFSLSNTVLAAVVSLSSWAIGGWLILILTIIDPLPVNAPPVP